METVWLLMLAGIVLALMVGYGIYENTRADKK